MSPQDWFNLSTFEAALEHLRGSSSSNPDQKVDETRLWSTPNHDLEKLFKAIYLDDIEQVQTCLEETVSKCHPLCDCDECFSGNKLLTLKDDMKLWTPLSLSCWLGRPRMVEFLTSNILTRKITDG